MSVFVALVHHPVYDRNGQIVTSSVTNFDLHDIARTCRTYGVLRYFVVHPSPDEQALNSRIVSHWRSGYGRQAHPTRAEALEILELVAEFSDVEKRIEELTHQVPIKVGTSARKHLFRGISFEDLREKSESEPVLLIFGTGYGLSEDWLKRVEFFLPPVRGPNPEYNHLSVRSAVGIILDRLLGIERS